MRYIAKMATKQRLGARFRKRVATERAARKMSQADLSKLLAQHGIELDATKLSKIESGTRAVQLDEAAALADIFGLSLDGLLDRHGLETEQAHAMTTLADTAAAVWPEMQRTMTRLHDAYAELQRQFDFASFDRLAGTGATWSFDGLDAEHQRALLMWSGRDLALHHMAGLMAGLHEIVAVRSMTTVQLAEHLDAIRQQLVEIENGESA